MKIKTRRHHAFMLVEVVIAMALFGIVAVAIMNGIIFGFHQLQWARHQSFATRTLVDETEILRLPYCRISPTEVISRYDATTNKSYVINQPDMTYYVKIYTHEWNPPNRPSYAPYVKVVNVKVYWNETPGRRCEVIWTTYVSKDSLLEQFIGGK